MKNRYATKEKEFLTFGKFFDISFYLQFFSVVLILIPNVNPYEGAQMYTSDVNSTTDWWDVAAPTIPRLLSLEENLLKWHFFQIFILISAAYGFRKLLPVDKIVRVTHKVFYMIISYLVLTFSVLGSRDGIAFSLTLLGIALITKTKQNSYLIRYIKLVFATIALILASQFKIASVVIISFLVFITIVKPWLKKSQMLLLGLFSFVALPWGTFELDKYLTETIQIQKTYPEQQVMLYDLAGVGCWSTSERAVDFANNALSEFLESKISDKELCRFLVPYGWDSLKNYKVGGDNGEKWVPTTDENKFLNLQKHWTDLLIKFPKDWLEFKTNIMGQVFFMSNFYDRSGNLINMNNNEQPIAYNAFLVPARILDKLFLLTYFIAFSFVIVSKIIYKNITINGSAIFILVTGVGVNILSYVADNGRYCLPYIVLFWTLVLRHNCRQNNETVKTNFNESSALL